MTIDQIITVILSLIGGGSLVAIIQIIAQKRKTKADTTDTVVKTIMEIEKLSTERYFQTTQRLELAESLIAQVKSELEMERRHNAILKDYITRNGLVIPERNL